MKADRRAAGLGRRVRRVLPVPGRPRRARRRGRHGGRAAGRLGPRRRSDCRRRRARPGDGVHGQAALQALGSAQHVALATLHNARWSCSARSRSVPYFVDLGGSAIWDANEAFYVETPREMIERGDYVSPTFNYEPRLNKPVLSYWIVAGFYHAVRRVGRRAAPADRARRARHDPDGVLPRPRSGPTAARLDGAIRDADRATEAALWAALGLAVTPRLLMFARRIFIDIYISMFMALTLLFFALAERYPARRRLFLRADVRRGRPRRADEGPGRDRAAGPRVRGSICSCTASCGRLRSMMLPPAR